MKKKERKGKGKETDGDEKRKKDLETNRRRRKGKKREMCDCFTKDRGVGGKTEREKKSNRWILFIFLLKIVITASSECQLLFS